MVYDFSTVNIFKYLNIQYIPIKFKQLALITITNINPILQNFMNIRFFGKTKIKNVNLRRHTVYTVHPVNIKIGSFTFRS